MKPTVQNAFILALGLVALIFAATFASLAYITR